MSTLMVYAIAVFGGAFIFGIVALTAFIVDEDDKPKSNEKKRASATISLKIFLDDKSFHCLKHCIPPGSRSKLPLEKAVPLNFFGSNTVISCEEADARNLLIYAGHCPGVIASIHKALRSADLPLEGCEE
jgi:hypothetical protein